MERILVFVYGTLRRGEMRNGVLQNDQLVDGEVYAEGFSMIDLGAYPGVIQGEGTVRGELYEISRRTLDHLDRIEGYREETPEEGLYDRVTTPVMLGNGSLEEAYIYVFNRRPGRRYDVIESGDWFEHNDLYAHNA